MGIKKIIIEGDSEEVIESLSREVEECFTEIRLCIEDCKSLAQMFDFINYKHVVRSRNKATHVLAKYGITCKNHITCTRHMLPWL